MIEVNIEIDEPMILVELLELQQSQEAQS